MNRIIAVAAGATISVALKEDGTVWTWGTVVGSDGDVVKTPQRVTTLSDVKDIACGECYIVAVKNDGTVWAWGENEYGQLGDGTTDNRTQPVQMQNISNVIAVSNRWWATFLLKADGTVWACGGDSGDMGTVSGTDATILSRVQNLDNVQKIDAGPFHTIALKTDGSAWTWGYNNYGSLGNGTQANQNIPTKVLGVGVIVEIAATEDNSYFKQMDGKIFSCGSSVSYMLGSAYQNGYCTIPIQIENVPQGSGIRVGQGNVFLILTNGDLVGWGDNWNGFLGIKYFTEHLEPYCLTGEINNIIRAKTDLNITADQTINVAISAKNMVNIKDKTFTVIYDPAQLELQNVCAFSSISGKTVGKIYGTDLEILSIEGGEITFTADKAVPENCPFSGVLNVLNFKAVSSGTTRVSVGY